MCIICVKPAGVQFPDINTLYTMFFRNPDGAGYMYPTDDGKVQIRKGFMNFYDFDSALFVETNERNLIDKTVVMHFRIGTHGGNTQGNTHPFPMTSSVKKMKKLNSTADIGIAHNGIIKIKPQRSDISDTMQFIRSGIVPLNEEVPGWMFDEQYLDLIERSINGSRMVFMDGNGQFSLVGNWVLDGGRYYSNGSFISGGKR